MSLEPNPTHLSLRAYLDVFGNVELDEQHPIDGKGKEQIPRILLALCQADVSSDELLPQALQCCWVVNDTTLPARARAYLLFVEPPDYR